MAAPQGRSAGATPPRALPPREHAPDWRGLPPPQAALRTSVIVPVRNEAPRLRATLAALARQVDAAGRPLDRHCFEIIVLANNCSDDSAAVVRRFAARHPGLALFVVEATFPPEVAHVGHARGCLMDESARRLLRTATGGAGIVASTDGDTRVARDWLAATLAEIEAGADAVGGRIDSIAQRGDPPGLRALVRRDALYQALRCRLQSALDADAGDPWPSHHQHFGASLALRADAYVAVGGCPAERFLEDEALVRRLRQHDLRLRHSPRVRVRTSGRREGRVEVGLSQQLRVWADAAAAGDDPLVPEPSAWVALLQQRQALRRAWLEGRTLPLHIAPPWLRAAWDAAPAFGTLWQQIEPQLATQQRAAADAAMPAHVPMRQAIATLRALLRQCRA